MPKVAMVISVILSILTSAAPSLSSFTQVYLESISTVLLIQNDHRELLNSLFEADYSFFF